MTDGTGEITTLIQIWHGAANDAAELLKDLDDAEWALPTALPGWNVKAVAAHLAHLEGELAGVPQLQVEVPPAPHVQGLMGQFTEAGVIARADWTPQQIIEDFESAVATRYAALRCDPPLDPTAPAPSFAGLVGWSWQTLLRNRPLDVWMHDVDIRRAVGREPDFTSPCATHVAGIFAASLPFVWGKKAQAPVGAGLLLELTGDQERSLAVRVGEDGRGRACEPTELDLPTTTVRLDFGDWLLLAGGRADSPSLPALVTGDAELGHRFLTSLAVMP